MRIDERLGDQAAFGIDLLPPSQIPPAAGCSIAPRSASPTSENPNTAAVIAAPGHTTAHGWTVT